MHYGSEDRKSGRRVPSTAGSGRTSFQAADAAFSLCPHLAEREGARFLGSLLKRAPIPFPRVELSWPNDLSRRHLLTPSSGALGFQPRNQREHKHSVHSTSFTWTSRQGQGSKELVSRKFRTSTLHSCQVSETRKSSTGNVVLLTTTRNCSVMWSWGMRFQEGENQSQFGPRIFYFLLKGRLDACRWPLARSTAAGKQTRSILTSRAFAQTARK